MPTATQITVTQLDLTGARCPALSCSGLQPSDAPAASMVATAISLAVQQFGAGGCAGRMAQEFSDHPGRGRQADALGPPAHRPGDRSPAAAGGGMRPAGPGRAKGQAKYRVFTPCDVGTCSLQPAA
jgi:hypothetical protein